MQNNVLYHASPYAGIKSFKLGIAKGEHEEPSRAIWFGTEKNGAADHIRITLNNKDRLRNSTGYVYECCLVKDAIVIYANNKVLPDNIFKKLKNEFKFYKRVFIRKQHWYKWLFRLSRIEGIGHVEDRLRVCKSLGIDALVMPRTLEDGSSRDDSHYGLTVAVVNPKKIIIIKEYSYSYTDKDFQEVFD